MDSFLKGKGRILFVDDEKPLVDIGKDMLESLGYQVELEQAQAMHWKPCGHNLISMTLF